MAKNSKTILIVVGVILAILAIVGLIYNYATTWMWILLLVGVIGIVWGWLAK